LKKKFIFDYENICNSIGLISDVSLYKQITFYQDKDAIEWNLKNSEGIFKDSKFLPVFTNVIQKDNSKLLMYGSGNQYQIKLFNNIIAQGTYGMIYDAVLENTETRHTKNIIIKQPKRHSIITYEEFVRNFINETVIQAHLFCAYEKEIKTKNLMRIPQIIMVGKTKEKTKRTYDYYVGMEKLSRNLAEHLNRLKETHGINSDIYAETFESVVNTVVKSLAFLQNKEKFMHRDLHCYNIMLDANDNLYMIDFGQALLLNRDVIINGNIYDDVSSHITPSKSYVNSHFNKSHDFRLFLASLFYYKFVPDRFDKIIAKRFSNCVFSYYKKLRDDEYKIRITVKSIPHCFYSDPYFIYDERFDVQVYPKMLEDYDDTNSNIPTLSKKDVAKKRLVYSDDLMSFVKNNYK
jgi:serine/threonine-protein kinase RIO1